jgi:hypothetical protein
VCLSYTSQKQEKIVLFLAPLEFSQAPPKIIKLTPTLSRARTIFAFYTLSVLILRCSFRSQDTSTPHSKILNKEENIKQEVSPYLLSLFCTDWFVSLSGKRTVYKMFAF